ncbi:2'-5'-phosphodiesterase 12-like [Sarcoptes scabiei]|nr:2'-5'-phosphodiesterase 12-like [Sarcoptes scabiei]
MDILTEIQERLRTKTFNPINKIKTNGCTCEGLIYEIDNGIIFVKRKDTEDALDMFQGEMISLNKILQTQTIRVPKPYFVVIDPLSTKQCGAIVMEYLDLKPVEDWERFGSELANLHLFNYVLGRKKKRLESWVGGNLVRSEMSQKIDVDLAVKPEIYHIPDELIKQVEHVSQFGFDAPTCCGKIPQNNEWHDNWIEFYARNKLQPQIDMVIETYGDRKIIEHWSQLQLKIDKFFLDLTGPIEPALLHGDLWSGNTGQVVDDPVIFDPSSFYGHSEYDFAIATLFGGFNRMFYDAYFRKIPQNKGFQKYQMDAMIYTSFSIYLIIGIILDGRIKIKVSN